MSVHMATPELVPQNWPTDHVLDTALLMRRVQGDRELLKELVQTLMEDLPSLLACLEQSVAERDALKTEQLAHALRSSVGTFAAIPATDAASRLERIGHQGDMTAAPQVCASLYFEISRLLSELTLLLGEDL